MSAMREGITLLREYRTRLIADVVTGKLDVRAAAANLPDEADEPEGEADRDAIPEGAEDYEEKRLNAAGEETEA
jgi:type I restriction enzyme S subunit